MRAAELVPEETEEQQALFQWAVYQMGRYPDLEWMYAVPNGGYRNKATAARLKAEGVKSGVPDICLPVPHGHYHGLYIEMKRRKGGKESDNQKRWKAGLRQNGYRVELCKGWEQAVAVILNYLKGEG